jgi:hypothetical protein
VPLAALGRQDDADLPAALALAVTAEAGLVHLDGPADLLQPGFTLSGYTLTNGTKKNLAARVALTSSQTSSAINSRISSESPWRAGLQVKSPCGSACTFAARRHSGSDSGGYTLAT